MNAFTVELWRSDEGCRPVIATRGTKYVHLLVQDYPVHIESRPLTEERYLTPISYPLARAVRKMRAFAKHGNHTGAAIQMLRDAERSAA